MNRLKADVPLNSIKDPIDGSPAKMLQSSWKPVTAGSKLTALKTRGFDYAKLGEKPADSTAPGDSQSPNQGIPTALN